MANSSGVYGRGLTKNRIAQLLQNVDTGQTGSYWDETIAGINKSYDEARDLYASQFNEAIEQAYASRRRNESLINMSTAVGGGKQALLGQADSAYEQAYDAYRQNLSKQNQALMEGYTQDVQEQQNTLEQRAENFATFGNMHYDYLQYLYNTYYLDADKPSGPWTNDVFRQMYLTTDTNPKDGVPVLDENDKQVVDEEGNPLYEHLRSMKSLYNTSYDEEGTYTSVYDENGYLTEFGKMYFDMIENMEYGQDVETFGDWLYQKDQDLWEYMYESPNIFDSSSDSTNAGTFRELTGRDARDYTYSIAEHLGALSKGTIKGFFNDVYSDIDSVFSGSLKDRAQSAVNNSEQIVDQIAKLTKDLGLETEFGDTTWDALKSAIKQADSYIKSGGEMTGDWFANTFSTTLTMTGAGAAIGAGGGSIVPGVGTGAGAIAGTIIGDIVGFVGGLIVSSVNTNNQRNQNEKFATQLKSQLQNTVDKVVAYSLAKHDGSSDTQKYYDELQAERVSSEPTKENVKRNNFMLNLL